MFALIFLRMLSDVLRSANPHLLPPLPIPDWCNLLRLDDVRLQSSEQREEVAGLTTRRRQEEYRAQLTCSLHVQCAIGFDCSIRLPGASRCRARSGSEEVRRRGAAARRYQKVEVRLVIRYACNIFVQPFCRKFVLDWSEQLDEHARERAEKKQKVHDPTSALSGNSGTTSAESATPVSPLFTSSDCLVCGLALRNCGLVYKSTCCHRLFHLSCVGELIQRRATQEWRACFHCHQQVTLREGSQVRSMLR
jgi:hypothetical protein